MQIKTILIIANISQWEQGTSLFLRPSRVETEVGSILGRITERVNEGRFFNGRASVVASSLSSSVEGRLLDVEHSSTFIRKSVFAKQRDDDGAFNGKFKTLKEPLTIGGARLLLLMLLLLLYLFLSNSKGKRFTLMLLSACKLV